MKKTIVVVSILALAICVSAVSLNMLGLVQHASAADSSASVTVRNVPPVASSASLNGEVTITLNEGTTVPATLSGTVTDNNGCADLTDVTVKVYTGLLSDCTAANNSTCYIIDDVSPAADTTCTSGGPTNLTYTVNGTNHPLAMQYYAAPGTWHATIIPADHAGVNVPGENTSTGTTVSALESLDLGVSPTISYGTVANGANSSGTHSISVQNTGNVVLNYNVSSAAALACNGFGNIPVANQEYTNDSSSFSAYDATHTAPVTALSGTPSHVTAAIAVSTGAASSKNSYWEIAVPYQVSGTCSGTVTFAEY